MKVMTMNVKNKKGNIKKIILLILGLIVAVLFIILIVNIGGTKAAIVGKKCDIACARKAISETALAFHRKGSNVQYDSYHKRFTRTPEDATKDDLVYVVCSAFVYAVYDQALGIKLPDTTPKLAQYAKDLSKATKYENGYKGISQQDAKSILKYYRDLGAHYDADCDKTNCYKDIAGYKEYYTKTIYEPFINMPSNGLVEYSNSEKNVDLQVGDILILRYTKNFQEGIVANSESSDDTDGDKGHVMIVIDKYYNNNTGKWQYKVIHAEGHNKIQYTNSSGNFYARDILEEEQKGDGEASDVYSGSKRQEEGHGSVKITNLKEMFYKEYNPKDLTKSGKENSEIDNTDQYKITSVSIIKPLAGVNHYERVDKEDGTYSYNKVSINSSIDSSNSELDNFNVTDEAYYIRNNYPKMDIYKISSVHTNSIVGLGDEIIYTIKIKNNSSQDYVGLNLHENIHSLVDVDENDVPEGCRFSESKKTFFCDYMTIEANSEKVISYKVKVSEKNENIGSEIKSTGNLFVKVINDGYIIKDKDEETSLRNNGAEIKEYKLKIATIKNQINNVLNSKQQEILVKSVEKVLQKYENGSLEPKTGLAFINDIYMETGFSSDKLKDYFVDGAGNGKQLDNILKEGSLNVDKENPFYYETIIHNKLRGRFSILKKKTVDGLGIDLYEKDLLDRGKEKGVVLGNLKIGDVIVYKNVKDKTVLEDSLGNQANETMAYLYLGDKLVAYTNYGWDEENKVLSDKVNKFKVIEKTVQADGLDIDDEYEIDQFYPVNYDIVTNPEKCFEGDKNICEISNLKINQFLANLSAKYGYVVLSPAMNSELVDTTAPIVELKGNDDEWSKTKTITISATDNISGLAEKPYSYTCGKKWTNESSKEYIDNHVGDKDICIKVKDKAGNETEEIRFEITKIDNRGPIVEIAGNDDEWSKTKTISIVASDNESGLADEPYSFDGGRTWESDASRIYQANQEVVNIQVKDKVGNITEKIITISKIDNKGPIVEIKGNDDEWSKTKIITIEAVDNESGLANEPYSFNGGRTWESDASRIYQANQEIVNIQVKDKIGNITEKIITISKIDNKGTIVELKGKDDECSKTKTITIEAVDNEVGLADEPYSFYGGRTWASDASRIYESNQEIVNIQVKDKAGNITEKTITISKIDIILPNVQVTEKIDEVTLSSVITIVANDEGGSDLADEPYSFDNGNTWISDASKVFTKSQVINVLVKDRAGNISEKIEYSIKVVDIKSDKYNVDKTKNYIYTGLDSNEDIKNNIIVENCEFSIEDDYLILMNSEKELKRFMLIRLKSSVYDFNNEFLYVGDDSDEEIINNIETSANITINNNILNINYGDDYNVNYTLVRLNIGYDISKNYIYTLDSNILEKVNIINGDKKIDNDNLVISYQEIELDRIPILTISSNKYIVTEDYIYTKFKNIDLVDINKSDGLELSIEDNKLIIKYKDTILDKIPYYYIISSSSSVITDNLDNKVYVITGVSSDNLISSLKLNATNENIKFNIYDENKELVEDGTITEGYSLEVLYGDKVIEIYNIEINTEYVEYTENASVYHTGEYGKDILKNLNINNTFKNIKDLIDTNGDVVIKDKDNNVLDVNTNIKTGDKFVVTFPTSEYFIHLSVKGDVTGKGNISNEDVLKSYEILRKRINVETYYELASDVVEDGDIKINDVAKLCQYVEKKISSLEE